MLEIVLDGPGKNALSSAMMEGVLEKLRAGYGAPVLLRGRGDAFCAGLDLKELSELDAAGMEAFLRRLEALVETLFTYPGPTVAHVNGHAIAGGCILALCCDHQVVANDPRIKIGLNELALGLQFPPVTLAVVKERIPKRNLSRVVLGGALHDPAAAHALGIVDEVADDAAAVAQQRLAALAAHAPAAYVATKRELRDVVTDVPDNEQRFLSLLPAWTSPEVKQRIAAALKK